MRLISWNVNGLRACLNKGFLAFCALADADVICLQETKMRPEQAQFELEGYHRFWNSADKAGYSGTAVFTRREPLAVTYDFGEDIHRHEGRVITAEYEDFFLVCCYTPNSKDQLARLDYRMAWEEKRAAAAKEAEAFAQQQRDAAKAQADKILSDAKDAAESERQKIVAEANREAVAIAEDAMEKLMAAQTAQAYDAFVNAAKEEQNEH